ncbi:serine/threonine-protein kinase [Nocardia vermiculata]|uniref:non-specific serine/threonine protein kinase n=1 Tax=Nocardia vermiculata TaxID=257274 RepID=A0A846Y1G1_9NOCA|nr:serine/threonine-protein kinase [Nocardia vermiculata]NKY52005.1 protein kinase [Nocardia vermiculata]
MLDNGDVFAGFTVQRLLGQGGMGSVYLARHPRLPRLTALKLLNRELYTDAEIRARFEREADLCAQLDHPGIVAVYDRGVEDDQLWICMQYVDGIDAATVDPRTLPVERAVQIIEGVADALDYAHGNGVMHRDVKPANILLARAVDGKGERVFLTDFGIARLREDSTHLTQAGMFTATLAYASPEQMTGAELDHRSDQYSLACALYWLLTGTGPFDSEHPTEVIRGHLQLPVPPASARRAGLSRAMDAVIARAMAKRSVERFGSCREFAAAARAALSAPAAGQNGFPGAPVPTTAAPPQFPPAPVVAGTSAGPAAAPAPPGYPAAPATTSGPAGYPSDPTAGPGYGSPTGSGVAYGTGAPGTPYSAALPDAGYGATSAPPMGYGSTAPGHFGPTAPGNYGPTTPGNYGPAAPGRPSYGPGAPVAGFPQPRKRSTGVVVGIVLAVLLLVAVVAVAVFAVVDSDSDAADAADHRGSASHADAMQSTFPQLVKPSAAGGSLGDGYDGQSCFRETDTSALRAPGQTADLKLGNWTEAWDCWGAVDKPEYAVLAYKSSSEVSSAIAALPANTAQSGTSADGVAYRSHLWRTQESAVPNEFWNVIEFTDSSRATYLIVAHNEYWTSLDSGKTYPEFDSWCRGLPLA